MSKNYFVHPVSVSDLDSLNDQKNTDRVKYEETFNYEKARVLLSRGFKVTRATWKGVFLEKIKNIIFKTMGNRKDYYIAEKADLNATDWKVFQ